MRWFGQVYIPMMAVVGLMLIISSLVMSIRESGESYTSYLVSGAILAAGASIGGAIQSKKS